MRQVFRITRMSPDELMAGQTVVDRFESFDELMEGYTVADQSDLFDEPMEGHAVADRSESFEEQLKEARKCTERLINVRERSSAELAQRLRKAGFADILIQKELEAVVSSGLIDDERFAQAYVESKKRSGWGKNRIEAKLRSFGIDIRLYEAYPERFFCEDEEQFQAEEYLKKFRTTSQDPRAACFRRLISRGFSVETARITVKKLTI